MTYGVNKQEVDLFFLPTPWIHDVNWTLIRRSQDILDVLRISFVRSA